MKKLALFFAICFSVVIASAQTITTAIGNGFNVPTATPISAANAYMPGVKTVAFYKNSSDYAITCWGTAEVFRYNSSANTVQRIAGGIYGFGAVSDNSGTCML